MTCSRCKKREAREGRSLCQWCKDQCSAAQRARYVFRLKVGTCVGCRRAKAETGKTRCASCGAEDRKAAMERLRKKAVDVVSVRE